MEVTSAGAGPPSLDPGIRLRNLPDLPAITTLLATVESAVEDSVGSLLHLIATPPFQELLSTVEAKHPPAEPRHAEQLIRNAAEAIAEHDAPRAEHAVRQLLTQYPDSPQPIQNDVRELVQRVSADAKTVAEHSVASAIRTLEPSAHVSLPHGGGVPSSDVISLANRFIETGQYVNYVRATELARLVIERTESKERISNATKPRAQRRFTFEFAAAWQRVPMLILLSAWLFVGVVGGLAIWVRHDSATVALEFWGVGFLALVGVQFVITIRNAR